MAVQEGVRERPFFLKGINRLINHSLFNALKMHYFQVLPSTMTLNHNEVHVWSVSLEIPPADLTHYSRILSASERERASRFHFTKDRNQFIVAKGILRFLIGRYLGRDPSDIQFSHNTHGKPSLKCTVDSKSLSFNVSHSGGRALYALSEGLPVGIDLERIRFNLTFESIAKRFFSPAEVTVFCSLQKQYRAEAFFNCWTRKEAIIKAKGIGLFLGLGLFDVSLRPGEPARLLRTRYDEGDIRNWSLHDIDAGSEFKAALAVKSIQPQISCYSWCP